MASNPTVFIEVVFRPDLPLGEQVYVSNEVPVPAGNSTLQWTLDGPSGSQFHSEDGVELPSSSPLVVQPPTVSSDQRTWTIPVENNNSTQQPIYVGYLINIEHPSLDRPLQHDPSLIVVPDPTGSL